MAALLPLHRIRHRGVQRSVPHGACSSRHCVAPPAPEPQALQISLGARVRYDVASRRRHFVGRPPRRGGIVPRNDGLARVWQRIRNGELSRPARAEIYVPHVRHRISYARAERINRRRLGPRARSCHRTARGEGCVARRHTGAAHEAERTHPRAQERSDVRSLFSATAAPKPTARFALRCSHTVPRMHYALLPPVLPQCIHSVLLPSRRYRWANWDEVLQYLPTFTPGCKDDLDGFIEQLYAFEEHEGSANIKRNVASLNAAYLAKGVCCCVLRVHAVCCGTCCRYASQQPTLGDTHPPRRARSLSPFRSFALHSPSRCSAIALRCAEAMPLLPALQIERERMRHASGRGRGWRRSSRYPFRRRRRRTCGGRSYYRPPRRRRSDGRHYVAISHTGARCDQFECAAVALCVSTDTSTAHTIT